MNGSLSVWRFGPYTLDPAGRALLRGDELVPVTSRAMDVLIALVRHRDRVVRKEELLELVWPDSFVQEANLTQNVFLLRKILGERPNDRRYILTVPGEGYRFVATVRDSTSPASAESSRSRIEGAWPAIRALAVLPFQTLNRGGEHEHVGLGLADALITRMSALRHLTVRPTGAVLQHAVPRAPDGQLDAFLVGRTLNVDALVLGTIQRGDGRLRVTVQLVSVTREATVWADRFDAPEADLFVIEDSISEQIKRALELELTTAEKATPNKRPTSNADAHEAYLKGRYFWNKRTNEGLRRAVDCFARAIALDPDYALAHAGIADCRNMLSIYSVVSPAEGCRRAGEAASRALAIDDTLAEAHTALAYARFNYDWDIAGAQRGFRRAFELKPNYAVAHQLFAEVLTASGQFTEAVASITRARQLDPTSLVINTDVALTLFHARRHEEAIAQLRETLDLEPGFWYALWVLGLNYEQLGRQAEALTAFEQAGAADPTSPEVAASIARAQAATGQMANMRDTLARLMDLAAQRYVSPFMIATIHAACQDGETAFRWLERAYDEHAHWLMFASVSPLLDPLRSDRRLQALVHRVRPGDPVAKPARP